MKQCMVLRCSSAPAVVRNVYENDPDTPALEFAVCQEHDRQITEGVPYRYVFEDRVVYMGSDIATAGQRLLVEYVGWAAQAGWPLHTHLHKFVDEAGDPFTVMIPDALLDTITDAWNGRGVGEKPVEED